MNLSILKKAAIAVSIAASAIAAHASTFAIGSLTDTYTKTVDISGSFDDLYTFTLPANFTGIKGSFQGFDYAGTGLITNFSFGVGSSSSPVYSLPLNSSVNGVDVASYEGSYTLAPGLSYWFRLSGSGDIANYTVTLAPVPEPESYALLLAGLGLMGFIARRRQAK